ncbi:ribonuclease HII [Bacillaceae bacterium S4-13-58]
MNKTVSEIKDLLHGGKITKSDWDTILQDDRKGVQLLVKRYEKLKSQKEMLRNKFYQMSEFENRYRAKGINNIAGVDEAGRGPLAGPVVVGAVILPQNFYLEGLDDSKKLNEGLRERFYKYIIEHAVSYSVTVIEPGEIDQWNILEATKRGMVHSIHNLNTQPEVVLIDAVQLEIPFLQESLIKGDQRSISIAAASIIAKVTRDRLMKEWGNKFPNYGFEKHMGYGTRDHLEALRKFGPTSIHRRTFSPVKEYL